MTVSYHPPLKEMQFITGEVLNAVERTKDLPNAVDFDTAMLMVQTVADYVKKVSFPLNAIGDREGCKADPFVERVIKPPMLNDTDRMDFDLFEFNVREFGRDKNKDETKITDKDKLLHRDIKVRAAGDGTLVVSAPQSFYEKIPSFEGVSERPLGYINVIVPPGFTEAYKQYCDLGLGSLLGDAEHGGMNMLHWIVTMDNEMLNANFPSAATGGLTGGVAQSVHLRCKNEKLKMDLLTQLYSGICSAVMDLTESNNGSDLGSIRTKAVPVGKAVADLQEGDKVVVDGSKMFITSGKHGMTENIWHYVLAKLPGAAEGTKGISVFLVPEWKVDENLKATDERNGVLCTNIEHKMGIKASPTCAISFEGAEGFLADLEGMKAMFVVMNDERLNVAMQGLTMAEIAFQNAAIYATERVQGKKITDSIAEQFTGKAATPVAIIEHETIREDLIDMKAQIDGWRALSYETAIQLDIAKHHPDAAKQAEAMVFVELMTPVLKACVSDFGVATAQRGIQIHGGMGFITETGVEQFYRDALIATIYEGTNDIQAMDFAFRKAANLSKVAQSMGADIMALKDHPVVAPEMPNLGVALQIFQSTAEEMKNKAKELKAGNLDAANDVLSHARPFMNMFGKLAVGTMWIKMMVAAADKAATEPANQSFYKNKLALGSHYLNTIMVPEMKKLGADIRAGRNASKKVDIKGIIPGME